MSVTQKKITFKNLNGEGISNAATSKKYAAIVVAHPAGGVKEQTSGIYANKVAAGGFVTLAYDASCQAAVDYMTTLACVDKDKIGILGVCASGGYTVNAAINDRRIKAVGTVSAVSIGFMYRAGWNGNQSGIVDQVLQVGAQARTDEANGQDITYLSWAPETIDDAPLATYDAFHQAKEFLTQPILMIAGEDAGTKFYSEELIETIKSSNKNASNYFVKGSNHFDMYDKPKFVDEAVSKFIPFYQEFLE
ncbi:Alpha/Beta hydrolase protein [Yarrowia lipolytica]|nr:Alpha/Beta hydrolase protein [Yarrowia lipolytica]